MGELCAMVSGPKQRRQMILRHLESAGGATHRQRALCKALDIAQIDEIVTDSGVAQEDVIVLEEAGRKVAVMAVESRAKRRPVT